jgi:hypothetical protein
MPTFKLRADLGSICENFKFQRGVELGVQKVRAVQLQHGLTRMPAGSSDWQQRD